MAHLPRVSLSLFVSLLVTTVAHNHHSYHDHHSHDHDNHSHSHHRHLQKDDARRDCGTADPSDEDRAAANAALQKYLDNNNGPGISRQTSFLVPVCFHILTGSDGRGDTVTAPTTAKLQAQFDALNRAYTANSCCDNENSSWCNADTNPFLIRGECSIDTGFSFAFARMDPDTCTVDSSGTTPTVGTDVTAPDACVNYIDNYDWAAFNTIGHSDCAMKQALRKGGMDVLNVYFVSFRSDFLGYASFPNAGRNDPMSDGVVNCNNCLPGDDSVYGEGDTLVHEVGHWLGLYHTFSNGCSPGDGVADTAPQREANYDCSSTNPPDTCSGDAFRDPIHNFMDYSPDACMFEFTTGQAQRALAQYQEYRYEQPVVECLTEDETTEAFDVGFQETKRFVLQSTDCDLTCTLSGNNGDADLYMSVGYLPQNSQHQYTSQGGSSNEQLTIGEHGRTLRQNHDLDHENASSPSSSSLWGFSSWMSSSSTTTTTTTNNNKERFTQQLLGVTLLCSEPDPIPNPTSTPTTSPSDVPTTHPTVSREPSVAPSAAPSHKPTAVPSAPPSQGPTAVPSAPPSQGPTAVPSVGPTDSAAPSTVPSRLPSTEPSQAPLPMPSALPTDSAAPSSSTAPSRAPSAVPSVEPSGLTDNTCPQQSCTVDTNRACASSCTDGAQNLVYVAVYGYSAATGLTLQCSLA